MAGTATDVLQAAMSQLSYRGSGSCDNPSSKFGRWYGVDPVQWCDCFVSWCLVAGGVDPVGDSGRHGGEAYVPDHLQNFKNINRFHSGDPQPGDVVFFKWPGESNLIADHIGIVHKPLADGSVVSVEGNCGVNESGYHCGNACGTNNYDPVTIVGFGRPHYGFSSMSASADAVFVEPILEEIMTWYDSKAEFETALAKIVRAQVVQSQFGHDGKKHGIATLMRQELARYFVDEDNKTQHRTVTYVNRVIRAVDKVKTEIIAHHDTHHR